MSSGSRRRVLAALGGLVLARPWAAFAAGRPCAGLAGQTIRWIVPYPPGGGFDVYSRLLVPVYEARLGTRILIDNVSGAGGRVGAATVRDARPDGRTLAIVDIPGLLVAALVESGSSAPHPGRDLTVLGRLTRSEAVWVTGRRSPFRTIEDVLTHARTRPLLAALSEVGSTGFVGTVVTAWLLGLDVALVAGYRGGRETSLAATRGDVDLLATTFESIADRIDSGDLRPLLQVEEAVISPHPSLVGVPLLGGPAGLAARRAQERGGDAEAAASDARALARLIGAGRVVVAPRGLATDLERCLEERLHESVTDPAFVTAAAAARRTLDPARGEAARAELQAALARATRFLPVLRAAVDKVRR